MTSVSFCIPQWWNRIVQAFSCAFPSQHTLTFVFTVVDGSTGLYQHWLCIQVLSQLLTQRAVSLLISIPSTTEKLIHFPGPFLSEGCCLPEPSSTCRCRFVNIGCATSLYLKSVFSTPLARACVQVIVDVTAWLILNQMKSEKMQANMLADQCLRNTWRKNCFRHLLENQDTVRTRPVALPPVS